MIIDQDGNVLQNVLQNALQNDIDTAILNSKPTAETALISPSNTPVSDTSSYSEDEELQDIKKQYKMYYAEDPNLCNVFRKLGLGEVMIVKAIDTFTIQKVRQIVLIENPYRLMDIDGFGFIKADNIGKQLGVKNEDPRRQRALIQSVLENNKAFGNTYLPTTVLEKECKKQSVQNFTERLKEMIDKQEVVLDENRIYLKRLYDAECEVSDIIRKLLGKEVIKHKFREPILAKMDIDSKAAEINIDDGDIPF